MIFKSPDSKYLLFAFFFVLFGFGSASPTLAVTTPAISLSATEVFAGSTTDLVLVGGNFTSSTTLRLRCLTTGNEFKQDITVNQITISTSTPTEMTANLAIASATQCPSDGTNRYHYVDVFENGPFDENGQDNPYYTLDSLLDIKNTIVTINQLEDESALFSTLNNNTINDALADALPGDTVLVDDGEYYENLSLDIDNIELKSKNGYEATAIIYTACDYAVFMYDNGTIDGFSLQANESNCNNGINIAGTELEKANSNSIKNMKIGPGLETGIAMDWSTGNNITNNIIDANFMALRLNLNHISSSTFSRNSIANNNVGIGDDDSLYPVLTNNFSENYWGSETGPLSHYYNPAGEGDAVSPAAYFNNWCVEFTCDQDLFTISREITESGALFNNELAYAENWLLRAPESAEASSTPSLLALQRLEVIIPTQGATSTVSIPAQTLITRTDREPFDASLLANTSIELETLSGFIQQEAVGQAIQWGLPSVGLSFNQPLAISLYVGGQFDGQALNIWHSNSTSSGWNTDGLGSPTCLVASGFCNFTTTKASYFTTAIDQPIATPPTISTGSNVAGSNNAGGYVAIAYPLPTGIYTTNEKSSSTEQLMPKKTASEMATTTAEKPQTNLIKAPVKKILGQKIYKSTTLLRDTKTKKIYLLIDNNKRVIRTLQELRQKYAGVRIYDLPAELLSRWKDI